MKIRIVRSDISELGWCAELNPDMNPYHRSWHYFQTRDSARLFAREMKKRYDKWQREMNAILERHNIA